MTRKYEIVYIFSSTLEEAQVNEHLDKFRKLLKTDEHPDPVEKVNHWGKRTLAYPINKSEVGYYVVVNFETDPGVLPEFERIVKLDQDVLRYLIVSNEGEVPAPPFEESDSKPEAHATPAAAGESE
ncbi:MAG: 30S ribosomal protein S6 [Gemmatimonadales bacterium]